MSLTQTIRQLDRARDACLHEHQRLLDDRRALHETHVTARDILRRLREAAQGAERCPLHGLVAGQCDHEPRGAKR